MIPQSSCHPVATTVAILVALAILPGCGDSRRAAMVAGDDDHDHDHEEKIAQLTIWTDRYEVFVEHKPPVAGEATPFIVHVTDLIRGQPLTNGPMTIVLKQDATALGQAGGAPAKAGIFQPELRFPSPGIWQLSLQIPSDDTQALVDLGSLRVYRDAHSAAHADLPDPPEGIRLLKEQQWIIGLRTAPASTRRLVERLRLPAIVTPRPGSLARVTPPLAGYLLPPPEGPLPLVGDRVDQGQTLASIRPAFSELTARLVEAETEVVRARLVLEQAELAFQRIEKLAKAEAKSGRELQEAEFAVRTAQAQYDAARALQGAYRSTDSTSGRSIAAHFLSGIELRSPIAGTLVDRSGAAVGEFITTEKPVFTVLDATTVFVEAPVPEASVPGLGATLAASYELPGRNEAPMPITDEGGGRLVFLGLQVDASTRTVPLIYEVPNPERRLRVGQSVTLHVATSMARDAVAIPVSALVEEGGRPIAFIQRDGETFEKRDIVPGIRDGNWVQVVSGVASGERIVTHGAFAVRLASISTTLPAHGHAH